MPPEKIINPDPTTAPIETLDTSTQSKITNIPEPAISQDQPQQPKKGKSKALIIVVTIIIVALAVAGALAVFKNHNKTIPAKTTTESKVQSNSLLSSPPSSAYTGWKTSTLEYEKLSFKYPPNWTIYTVEYNSSTYIATNYSSTISSETAENRSCDYPGDDSVTLTAPNQDTVNIMTGNQDCSGDNDLSQGGSIPIKVLNNTYYLSFINTESSNGCEDGCPNGATSSSVTGACLSTSSKEDVPLPSKNITIPSEYQDSINGDDVKLEAQVMACFDWENITTTSVSSMQKDPSFATAKLIFESMTYM
jgi:hypothetical protein